MKELTDDEKAEIAREYMEKTGQLKSYPSAPTGGMKNDLEKLDAYIRGEASEEDYLQAKKNLGI